MRFRRARTRRSPCRRAASPRTCAACRYPACRGCPPCSPLVRHAHHELLDLLGLHLVRWISSSSESSGAWIGEPTDQRLMLVLRISKSSPSRAPGLRLAGAPRGNEEVALAREDVLHAAEAVRHHGRRRDAVARRHAAEVEAFSMCSSSRIQHEMPEACCARIEGGAHLIVVQADQHARRGRGAEHRAEAVRRVAVLAELVGVERHREPGADVVTQRDGAQQRFAALPLLPPSRAPPARCRSRGA